MSDPVMLWGQPADLWTALAALGTVVVAAAAAVFAFFQVREAKRLREEQAQPFVVVDLEPNPSVDWVIEVVISNLGATLARNVRFRFDPPLQSSQDNYNLADSLLFKQGVPSLPPGKVMRFLLDVSHERFDAGLPNVYRITVDCDGPTGKSMPTLEYVCDLDILMPLHRVGVKNIHNLTQEVEKIRRTLGEWTEDKALSVIAFEGWDWRERRRKDAEERAEKWRQRKASQAAATAGEQGDADGDGNPS